MNTGSRHILIYQPHVLGRTGLRILFALATLLLFAFIPTILDPSNLPEHQADMPSWVLIAFVALALFALAWNAYWFLVGSASEVQLDAETLSWETGVGRGEMRVEEIVEIRNRLKVMPTVFTETARVGLFPANGIEGFVDAITASRPELCPASLGMLSELAKSRRHQALHTVKVDLF